jgi:hypothetical protein
MNKKGLNELSALSASSFSVVVPPMVPTCQLAILGVANILAQPKVTGHGQEGGENC